MVQINMPLPESDSVTVAPTDLSVMLFKDGEVTVKGRRSSMRNLERDIAEAVSERQRIKIMLRLSIISESGTNWEKVHKVIQIASGLKIKAIIATEPRG